MFQVVSDCSVLRSIPNSLFHYVARSPIGFFWRVSKLLAESDPLMRQAEGVKSFNGLASPVQLIPLI